VGSTKDRASREYGWVPREAIPSSFRYGVTAESTTSGGLTFPFFLPPAPSGSEQQGPKIVNVSAGDGSRNCGKLPHKRWGREKRGADVSQAAVAAVRDDPRRSAELAVYERSITAFGRNPRLLWG